MPDDEPKKTERPGDRPGDEAEVAPPKDDPPADPGEDAAADKFRPEAIAARVDTLGEESDIDRIARVEEKKLLDRRKGKKGPQASASKRLAKIGEVKVKRPSAIATSPDADPLLERTARLYQVDERAPADVRWARRGGVALRSGRLRRLHVLADQARSRCLRHPRARVRRRARARIGQAPTTRTTTPRRRSSIRRSRPWPRGATRPSPAITTSRRSSPAPARRSWRASPRRGLLLDAGDATGGAGCRVRRREDFAPRAGRRRGPRARHRGDGLRRRALLAAQSDAANKDRHLDDALGAFPSSSSRST